MSVKKENVLESKFNLDSILMELGSFGKYQILLLIMLSFRDGFLYMCNLNYVFVAADCDYRCHVPECDRISIGNFSEPWSMYAMPQGKLQKCTRYTLNSSYQGYLTIGVHSDDHCTEYMFNKGGMVPCNKFIYANNQTLYAEFDLGCQEWKLKLIGTVHNIGIVVSLIISGLISDRYGRKVIICATPLVVAVFGLLKSFSTSYTMYIVLEFIESAFGYGTASFIYVLEAVPHNKRVITSSVLDMSSTLIGVSFSLIAWLVPYWRNLLRIIYTPLLIIVFYIFLFDEGIRWLLSKGKNGEALRIIQKVAKTNNVQLSNNAINMIKNVEQTVEEKTLPVDKKDLIESLKSPTIWIRLAACSFFVLSANFVYYGLIINSVNMLSGNKYVNFALVIFIGVPARIVTVMCIDRYGRKKSIVVTFILCGISCLAYKFTPHTYPVLATIIYLISNMAISFVNYTLFVFTFEIFPTVTRNTLGNICFMIGRMGSVLAPQTPLLAIYMDSLPAILFGGTALVAGVLMILMPDTANTKLPDNIIEAEKIGRTDDELEKNIEKVESN